MEEVLEFHKFSKQGEAETPRHRPRTCALTSELADSCCRNKQTRVSTHTDTNVISTIVHTSSSRALQHAAHPVHKLEWEAHCLSININCPPSVDATTGWTRAPGKKKLHYDRGTKD